MRREIFHTFVQLESMNFVSRFAYFGWPTHTNTPIRKSAITMIFYDKQGDVCMNGSATETKNVDLI